MKHTPEPYLLWHDIGDGPFGFRLVASHEDAIREDERANLATGGEARTHFVPWSATKAAPDMLAALKAARPYLRAAIPTVLRDRTIEDVEAAIAKATNAQQGKEDSREV